MSSTYKEINTFCDILKAFNSTKTVLKAFKDQINTDKMNNIKATTTGKYTSKIKILL